MSDTKQRIRVVNKTSSSTTIYLAPEAQAKATQIYSILGDGTLEIQVTDQELDYLLRNADRYGVVAQTIQWQQPSRVGTARIGDITYQTLYNNGAVGMGPGKLAPGDHDHDGVYVKVADLNANRVAVTFSSTTTTKVVAAGLYSNLKSGTLVGAYYRTIDIPAGVTNPLDFTYNLIGSDNFAFLPNEVYVDTTLGKIVFFFDATFNGPCTIIVRF